MLKGTVSGRVQRWPGGRVQVPLDVESFVLEDTRELAGGFAVLARIPSVERRRAGDLLPGRRLEIEGRLSQGRASDRAFLEQDGLSAVLDAGTVWRLRGGSTAAGLAARLARRARDAIRGAELGRDEETVLRAMFLGERSELAPELKRAFVATGTIHLLVTGGLHVALLAALLGAAVRALPLPDVARRVLVVAFVLAYLALVGPRPGAVRATVGTLVFVAAGSRGGGGDGWNRLAVALLVVLAWDPAAAGEAGFQLSFGTVAGILALSRAFTRTPRGLAERGREPPARLGRFAHARERVLARLRRELVSSTAAFLAHAPLAVAWFGRLSPIGLAANVGAVPLAAATIAPGAVGVALGAVHPLFGRPFLGLAGIVARILVGLVRLLARVPWGSIEVARPSPAVTALALGLGAFGLFRRAHARSDRARRRALLIASAGLLLWLAAILPGARPVELPGLELVVRPAPDGAVVSLRARERSFPLADAPLEGVLVERLRGERVVRIERGGRAALVLAGDLGGRELGRLLLEVPEGKLRASVVVAPRRSSRALETLLERTRPLVTIVPSARPESALAETIAAAGGRPLSLAGNGAVAIELDESVSVRTVDERR
jgi:competence protein ComEC